MSSYASYDRSGSNLLGTSESGPQSGYVKMQGSHFSSITGQSPYQNNNNSYRSVRDDLRTDKTGRSHTASRLNRITCSKLSDEFFGRRNIERIQKKIRKEIYRRSGGRFRMTVDQNENNLLVVMNEIYERYAENRPRKIRHQTKCLNDHLVKSIVPNMITEIKQQYKYIQEINSPIDPISRPVNVNSAGRTTLPSFSTVW